MSKPGRLVVLSSVLVAVLWFGDDMGLVTVPMKASVKNTAAAVGTWLPPETAAANTDKLPDARRLLEIYEQASTVAEIGVANETFRAELATIRNVAAAVSDVHRAATKSCAVAEQFSSDVAVLLGDKSNAIFAALVKIDTWFDTVVKHLNKVKPFDEAAANRHRRDFGELRVDAEQTIASMQALVATFPRLATSCSTSIPRLRDQPQQ
jgi:hypothetical protein